MKKLFVLLAVSVASVSAASAQNWGIGGRLGTGEQLVIQKFMPSDNYWELRAGYSVFNGGTFDASLLHFWNIKNWDWTPGNWFLDIGAGANVGAGDRYLFVGAQASGKFGYTFEKFPLSIAADVSPSLGPKIGIKKGYKTDFDAGRGLLNIGISATYRF